MNEELFIEHISDPSIIKDEMKRFENWVYVKFGRNIQEFIQQNNEKSLKLWIHDFYYSDIILKTPNSIGWIPEFSTIIPDKLYLGPAMVKLEELKDLGIKNVLNCCAEVEPFEGFNVLHLKLEDRNGEDIKSCFEEAIKFIENSEKVYVHCLAGISRSSTIVIAYIGKKYNLSFLNAYKFVHSKRPCIEPNKGFCYQLIKYLK